MNYKIFIKVFFEKSKYLIMYSLSIITFWYALFINIASDTYNAYYQKSMPDIEVYGDTANIENSYMLYKGLDSSIKNELMQEGAVSYGLTVRNLYTFSDAYYHVSYRIYGAENEFLNKLSSYLKKGRLPEAEKTEAVIGSNVAKFFDLKIGDVLDVPITLEEDADAAHHEYVVCGIITADASFFCDGIYISKDTYENLEHKVADNMLYIYTKTKKSCQSVIRQLEEDMNGFGAVIHHYEYKISLHETIQKALIKTIPLSTIVLTILFVSLMKYTGRKIGLMKALGISDRYIMKLLIKGFGVYNLIGMLLSYLSLGFIRLSLGVSLPASVILYSVYSFAIIFIVTIIILFILCKKISPKLAMYPY